jgi:hypothetical protein
MKNIILAAHASSFRTELLMFFAMQMVQSRNASTNASTRGWQRPGQESIGSFYACDGNANCGATVHISSSFPSKTGPRYSLQNTTAWCGPSWIAAQAAVRRAESAAASQPPLQQAGQQGQQQREGQPGRGGQQGEQQRQGPQELADGGQEEPQAGEGMSPLPSFAEESAPVPSRGKVGSELLKRKWFVPVIASAAAGALSALGTLEEKQVLSKCAICIYYIIFIIILYLL